MVPRRGLALEAPELNKIRLTTAHFGIVYHHRVSGRDLRGRARGAPAFSTRRNPVPRQWKVMQHDAKCAPSCDAITDSPAPSHPIEPGRIGQFRRSRRVVRSSRGPLISRRFRFACSSPVADRSANRSISRPANSEAVAANLRVTRRPGSVPNACSTSRTMASDRVFAPFSRRHLSICRNTLLDNFTSITASLAARCRERLVRATVAVVLMDVSYHQHRLPSRSARPARLGSRGRSRRSTYAT